LGAALTSAGIASIEIPQNVLQILQKRSARRFRGADSYCETFCKRCSPVLQNVKNPACGLRGRVI